MTFSLAKLLSPERLTAVVDVGANPIDGVSPYQRMLDEGLCTVVGFEPQFHALDRLIAMKGPHETYLPYAVGDGRRHVLHICKAEGMSSLLKPDERTRATFQIYAEWGAVIRETPIETRRLDDINEVTHIDLLKVDVQGSELSVFLGGVRKLRNTVAIQTEVSFLPLYKDQPLNWQIEHQLRDLGFVPHAFTAMRKAPIAPMVLNNDPSNALNQVLEADIVYVRDFTCPDDLTNEQLKHLALIAHHCYGSWDLTLRCVCVLAERGVPTAGAPEEYVRHAQS